MIDSEGNKIPLVSVQLLDYKSDNVLSNTQSNKNGTFLIEINKNVFPLKLKFQHFSFETKILEIHNSNFLQIKLSAKENILDEIIIESKSYDVVKRGDTLVYNLQNLMDGSELKLKDFVNKLPGFSIDEDGKIRYNGALIDHLLIDGNEFFDNKHQIANENITAEMIEKLELITNYKGLSNMKEFDKSGKLALNIGINEKFKNTLKANVTAEGGYKEQYYLNGHLFNFGKKTLFSLIANTNNTNQNVLTVNDYVQFRNSSAQKMLSQNFIQTANASNNDLPSFLFAQDDSEFRKLSNITLNLSHKFNEKERIEFISIYNYLNQKQSNFSEQFFFDSNANNITKFNTIVGNSDYFSNVLKYEKKFKNTNYLRFNVYSLFSKDFQNQEIQNFFQTNLNLIKNQNRDDFDTMKYGINAEFKKPINKNWLLEFAVFYDRNQNKINKFLFSSNAFTWLNSSQTNIYQQTKLYNDDLGAQASLNYKWNLNNISFKAFTGTNKQKLDNDIIDLNNFRFRDSYKRNENSMNLQYSSFSIERKFNYGLGLKFNNSIYNYKLTDSKTINTLLPNVYFVYNFTKKFTGNFTYSSNVSGFSIYNFLTGNLINDYRSYVGVSDIKPKPLISDSFNLGFSYNFVEENIFSTMSISQLNVRKNIQKTFVNSDEFAEEIYDYFDLNRTTSIMFSLNKKFYQIPYSIKLNSYGTLSNFNTQINEDLTENKNLNLYIDFALRSYYKNSFMNYNLGVSYINNRNQNIYEFQKQISKLTRFTPFLYFNGTLLDKKLIWNLDSKYYIYKASTVKSKNVFDFSFKTQYNLNNKFQFYINAKNVLNIKDTNTKNNFLSTAYFSEEIIMRTLSGFINLGVLYSF